MAVAPYVRTISPNMTGINKIYDRIYSYLIGICQPNGIRNRTIFILKIV